MKSLYSERELLTLCLQGNKTAQKTLFEMYAGKMITVCRRYSRTLAEAEDIAQEGFIRVFQNLKQFNKIGSLESWIRRIMVNTALKYISKKSFQNEILGIEHIKSNTNSIDPNIYSKLGVEELMKLIHSLPSGYKIIFNLYGIEGYSHREIAHLLQINESTSRSQLHKARRLLIKWVKQENNRYNEAS